MSSYVVATIKDWHIKQFHENSNQLNGNWHLITSPDVLSIDNMRQLAPEYIFFPHWSWLVPEEILNEFNCVCFHMTDVPYGRGGSPLQNLIIRGHKKTMLTALKMEKALDSGPIYLKVPLSLKGSAQEIYSESAKLIIVMMKTIATIMPEPLSQEGPVELFKRRSPKQSELPNSVKLEQLYDHIRMLDADTYPKAFLNFGNFKLEFNQAQMDNDHILKATVTITNKGTSSDD